ncbi:heparinase II/III family protein [Halomicroarcula sp. GCM10025894]
MAGALFDGEGEAWLQQGVDVLREARDQFLADGGHFERSPMYHSIALVRYLTAVDLLRRQGRSVPTELREVALEATAFLQRLRPPDDRIPLLNDAVFGEAPPLSAVCRYADAVGVDATATPGSHCRRRATTGSATATTDCSSTAASPGRPTCRDTPTTTGSRWRSGPTGNGC